MRWAGALVLVLVTPVVWGSLSPTSALAQDKEGLRVAIGGEAGWRWTPLGHDSIPRVEDTFQMGYHAALSLQIGGSSGGFYTYARFDGFAPTGLDTFPFMAEVRLGYFSNVHYFDVGGPRESTSTHYQGTRCYGNTCYDRYQERTTRWWEPSGWVNGLRYIYGAGRLVSGTEVVKGSLDTQYAAAAAIGVGMMETKFTTWFVETEILFFPGVQWQEEERSEWGWYFRGGALFGPVFIDLTVLLDPAIGGELSIGAGFMLGN